MSRAQMDALRRNCDESGIACFGAGHRWQGIVHVIGPELGLTHAGQHHRLRRLAHGDARRLRRLRARHRHLRGRARPGDPVSAPGAAAHAWRCASRARCRRVSPRRTQRSAFSTPIGTAGAAGHVVEYTGAVVRGFSMEQRMTLCNLTIEGGGRAGMIAPDDVDLRVPRGRRYAPRRREWDAAVAAWRETAQRRRARATTAP